MQSTGNQEQLWMLDTGEQGILQQPLSKFVCILNWGNCVLSLTSVVEVDILKSCSPQSFTSVSSLWLFSKTKTSDLCFCWFNSVLYCI